MINFYCRTLKKMNAVLRRVSELKRQGCFGDFLAKSKVDMNEQCASPIFTQIASSQPEPFASTPRHVQHSSTASTPSVIYDASNKIKSLPRDCAHCSHGSDALDSSNSRRLLLLTCISSVVVISEL